VKRRLLGTILVLIVGALAGLTAGCESELPGDAVAKVGDVYITVEALEKAVAPEASAYGITEKENPDTYKYLQQTTLENLIVNQLVVLEATGLGLTVTDEEVQTEFDSYVSSYQKGDRAAFEKALAEAGLTTDDFKQNIREGLLRERVKAVVVKDVTTVPEEQIAAYYEANKTNYYVEPSRQMRHILITPQATGVVTTVTTATTPSVSTMGTTAATTSTTAASTSTAVSTATVSSAVTEADWAAALATAKEVRRKLVAGGDWTVLAKQYSDDFVTKDSGGDLGKVVLGEKIKDFEDAAFSLGLDETSQPLRTVYGYEIIQVTSVTKGGQQTLDEVRGQIESELVSAAQEAALNKWVEKKKSEVSVIYRKDLRPPTTVAVPDDTTTTAGPTSSTASTQTTTTVKP
jgi:parvulin-like peptidyl-prolyl isomerase